jgi:hypothetical protein
MSAGKLQISDLCSNVSTTSVLYYYFKRCHLEQVLQNCVPIPNKQRTSIKHSNSMVMSSSVIYSINHEIRMFHCNSLMTELIHSKFIWFANPVHRINL